MNIRTLCTVTLLTLILFTAFLIRIQGAQNIPEGQFTGTDAYFYYWQAHLISEHGKLPQRDMHRWLPLGRDLGQTLNLYGYVLAYTHKAVESLFPKVSLYQVALYTPVVCFCIGLGILCFFLWRAFGTPFSCIVGILLATLPGSIERSTTGFSDRDAWCLMIGVLSVITYLVSLQTQHRRKQLLWTFASGFSVFLGGLSWEGFGVFLSVIMFVEFWRFLTSEKEEGFDRYVLWVCTFVPTLYLVSPVYRNGYGFAKYVAAFMLVPPLLLLGMRLLRHLLLTRTPFADKLRPQARTLAFGITLSSIAIALGYIFMQLDTFGTTTVPLSQNTLMKSVGELNNPSIEHWMIRYGSVFLLGCLGVATAVIRFWKIRGLLLAGPLTLFVLTAFYRSRLDGLLGTGVGNLIFGVGIATCILGILTFAWRKNFRPKNEIVYVAFYTWLLFWAALTRDAQRYDFFIGPALAVFTTDLILFLADFYGTQIKKRMPQILLKTAITAALLAFIMFWSPVGGHAQRTLDAATKMRRAIPGNSELTKTLHWIKDNLPGTAVVAGNWDYGSLINVIGGVKTIVDQDHYIQHWIYLYNRHVHCANTLQEALEFLKSHEVTHLILDAKDTLLNSDYYSSLGSNQDGDIRFTITPLHKQPPKAMKYRAAPDSETSIPLKSIDFELVSESTLSIKAELQTGETIFLPAVAITNKGRVNVEAENEHGGILIVFDEAQHPTAAYYIPPIGWDSLAIRLYFRGDIPDVFVPVYPADADLTADFKIWEIHYPPGIKPNPKYIETGIPEIDIDLQP